VRRVLLVDAPAVLGWTAWREHDAAGPARLLEEGLAAVGQGPAVAALLNGAMNDAALWIAAADDPEAALEEAWAGLRRMLAALS